MGSGMSVRGGLSSASVSDRKLHRSRKIVNTLLDLGIGESFHSAFEVGVFSAGGGEVLTRAEAVEDAGLKAVRDKVDMEAGIVLSSAMRSSERLRIVNTRP